MSNYNFTAVYVVYAKLMFDVKKSCPSIDENCIPESSVGYKSLKVMRTFGLLAFVLIVNVASDVMLFNAPGATVRLPILFRVVGFPN